MPYALDPEITEVIEALGGMEVMLRNRAARGDWGASRTGLSSPSSAPLGQAEGPAPRAALTRSPPTTRRSRGLVTLDTL